MVLNKMDTSELLISLKKESFCISNSDISLARVAVMEAVRYVPEPYKTIYSAEYFKFLYMNFLELKNCDSTGTNGEIDAEVYDSLLRSIRGKSYLHDTKKEALNRFTRLILAYLVFIAKRPLHPVGMLFPGGSEITQKEQKYYCPVKDKQSETGISFCEFCICRDSAELK
ncbi:DUF2115 domain-containing protein [Methanolobus psychrotolerans]|uniref:DUF2115 domain-containing protein n=1 Tax=Methanolobus psychrotolerans TaxID=1874706 RepID=UPI0013EA4657|nr:DUF2115 domain-containing protein [Methanolobus psychrotolerans]